MNIEKLIETSGKLLWSRLSFKKHDIKLIKSIIDLLSYRLTWAKYDLDHVPTGVIAPQFMSAKKAIEMIHDNATVISTGIGGNSRCSILYWAVRDRYLTQKHPAGLTWITVAGVGGRGKAPGTIEEIGVKGLVACHIAGHMETHKSLLQLADDGDLELHVLPQGVTAFLLEALGRGEKSMVSRVGLGTFLDPRTGRGSAVTSPARNTYVRAGGDETLEYTLPNIDVAAFSAPYADAEGNIYFKHAATITENRDAAIAAKRNNGKVIVEVSGIIEKSPSEIAIASSMVDAIVVNPRSTQTGGALQRKYMPMFTEGAKTDVVDGMRLLKLTNIITGITPHRGPMQDAMSRMAASLFVEEAQKGAIINLGIGLPEEVGRLLFESGIYKDLISTTESGVYGGVPTPGIYFGAAINPQKIMSSAEMFHLYEEKLDITVLGFLQVDSDGSVNVSRRGPKMMNYVGPGGFPNMVSYAKTIIFIGNWMEGANYSISGGKVKMIKGGIPKFVERVDEVTMNGKIAAREGKKVYYVTSVGIFQLTEKGLELIQVMPGIDIERDILRSCQAKIIVPKGGDIPIVGQALLTGQGFALALRGEALT